MKTGEEHYEDVPQNKECHIDSEENTYGFACGLDWTEVIKDAGTGKYN